MLAWCHLSEYGVRSHIYGLRAPITRRTAMRISTAARPQQQQTPSAADHAVIRRLCAANRMGAAAALLVLGRALPSTRLGKYVELQVAFQSINDYQEHSVKNCLDACQGVDLHAMARELHAPPPENRGWIAAFFTCLQPLKLASYWGATKVAQATLTAAV